jgi:hypothetical protein
MANRALPFPYPLRLGTDICHTARIYAILASPRGPRFIERVLHPEERAPGRLPSRVARILGESRRDDEKNLTASPLARSRSHQASRTRQGSDGSSAGASGAAATASQRRTDTGAGGSLGRGNDADGVDSALWAAAQFMAGRCVSPPFLPSPL